MARVLIVAEHDGARLNPSTAKCVSCAHELRPESLAVAVFASDGAAVADQAARLSGVTNVVLVKHALNAARPLAATLAPQVAALSVDYTHVLGPATTFGKDVLPRVAALLGVGQLSDVMAVESEYRFRRPTYAGNAIVTVDAPHDRVLVATVRGASYAAAGTQDPVPVEQREPGLDLPSHTRFVELRAAGAGRPDLQTAARVVAGGRALGSAENFKLIEALADRLGAAVGASRAAVDSGFAPNDLQVGQTGKIIAPELYFAIGISGAIQHLTGIKDARTIVAINSDRDAPIFEVADVGLVADLFRVLPELLEALAASRSA